MGELAEDSLEVPSYKPGVMSACIDIDWLSAEWSLYCPAAMVDSYEEAGANGRGRVGYATGSGTLFQAKVVGTSAK